MYNNPNAMGSILPSTIYSQLVGVTFCLWFEVSFYVACYHSHDINLIGINVNPPHACPFGSLQPQVIGTTDTHGMISADTLICIECLDE